MNQEKMSEFFKSLNFAIEKTDSGTFWPGGGGQIGSPFIAIDAFDLHQQLLELKKQKTAQELVDYFYNPSIIKYVAVGNFIIGLKVLIRDKKVNIESAKESLDFFLDILDAKMSKDPFCTTGANNWFKQDQINALLEELKFHEVTETNQGLMSRLVIALNSLVWSFYYDIYVESGFEFHGPYNVKHNEENYSLVIRDYHDLKPTELWDNAKKFNFKSIKLYLLYSNVNISLDYFMHEISDEPLRTNLKCCVIETVDSFGKREFISIQDTLKISESAEKLTFDQVNFVNQLETLDKIKQGAMICYYQLKNFREKMNIDWKPPKKVFDAIDKKGLEKWEKFKARASTISAGEANIDWSSKYDLDKPL
jgi:hypothetical protein